ncbi:MAG: glycosyltransferase [Candidatus Electrothrix sp. AW5]|nr:glycosyltransferase [Candidatus Electrothrix gigas]
MSCAPIALFVYNRPDHLRRTVSSLQKNTLAADSELIVFSDGPKINDRESNSIKEVREYLKGISGFRSVRVVERAVNWGLAASIINGVNQVLQQYENIIVLEDDLVTSPFFLKYMNNGLNTYASDERVISIHGYSYPIKRLPENFFLKGADCWGWATWRRGWEFFEEDGVDLLNQLKRKKLMKRFDFNGTYNYTKMLINQIEGKNDSWAVRWYASALINNKLTLYPGNSLVKNIGLDGSGSHCGRDYTFNTTKFEKQPIDNNIPVEEHVEAFMQFQDFFSDQDTSIDKKGFWNQVLSVIKRFSN